MDIFKGFEEYIDNTTAVSKMSQSQPQPQPPGWMDKIREDGTEALSEILRKIPGAKYLIFDPLLIAALDFFIGPGFIQANEVRNMNVTRIIDIRRQPSWMGYSFHSELLHWPGSFKRLKSVSVP